MDLPSNIPNFATIDVSTPATSRGGEPTDAGWNWLKEQGFTRVVKLNSEDESSEVAAEALGMEVIYEPISEAEQLIFRPDLASVRRAVDAIGAGTFVHCGSLKRTLSHIDWELNIQGGQDRTGLIVGCYRVWKQGWDKGRAWQEMLDHGFHPELLGLTLFWEYAVN